MPPFVRQKPRGDGKQNRNGSATLRGYSLHRLVSSRHRLSSYYYYHHTTQSTPLPLAGSDSPHLNTTTAMAPTTTTTSASNAGLVVPHSSNSQLQPHHLANLLCQAALQFSGNLSHVLPQLQLPTEALVPPATTVTATAQVTTSNQPRPSQQEDQLSEASALIPTIPSPVTPLPTTITRNPPPLDTTLDPTSSLSQLDCVNALLLVSS